MEVVSWLHFPSDISICVTFPPEFHPLSPFRFSVFFWFQAGNFGNISCIIFLLLTSLPPTFPQARVGSLRTQSFFISRRRTSFTPLHPTAFAWAFTFPYLLTTIPLPPPSVLPYNPWSTLHAEDLSKTANGVPLLSCFILW